MTSEQWGTISDIGYAIMWLVAGLVSGYVLLNP